MNGNVLMVGSIAVIVTGLALGHDNSQAALILLWIGLAVKGK